jgi:transposase
VLLSLPMPSLSAVKKIPQLRDLYIRLVQKSGIKMKGLVAVQRKLLELIYIIYKGKTVFEKDYELKKREQFLQTATL